MKQFATLTEEVKRNTKHMQFIAYDLNKLGYHAALGDTHPQVWFSGGSSRDQSTKLYRGEMYIEQLAEWLKKHADNKFKMSTKNLDQKLQMLEMAQQQGIGLEDGQEKPKNIMDEVEAELRRRGEEL